MVKASLNSRKSASQSGDTIDCLQFWWSYQRLLSLNTNVQSLLGWLDCNPIREHCFALFTSCILRFLGRDFCSCLPSHRWKAKLRLIWNKHKPLYSYIVGHWYMALCRVQFYLIGRIYENINLLALMSSYLFFLTFVYFCCIIPFIHVCVIIPVLVKPFQFVVNLLSFWRDIDF